MQNGNQIGFAATVESTNSKVERVKFDDATRTISPVEEPKVAPRTGILAVYAAESMPTGAGFDVLAQHLADRGITITCVGGYEVEGVAIRKTGSTEGFVLVGKFTVDDYLSAKLNLS